MSIYYQLGDQIYVWNNFKRSLNRVQYLPIDDVYEQAEEICDDVAVSVDDEDDHVLFMIEMRTLVGICIYRQDSSYTYISTFCARRGRGVEVFNMFKRTGMLGINIKISALPRAIKFYKSLGFIIDDTDMYVGTEGRNVLHPDIQDRLGDETAWIRVTIPYSVVAETLHFWSDVHTVPMTLTL